MNAGGLGQRLAVFVVFAALTAAAAGTFRTSVPAAAPTDAELAALETKLAAAARLHPLMALPAPAGPGTWCAECHPGLPHPGVSVARAMLNEHAGRMDCLLCHWPAAGGARPVPVWQVQAGSTAFLSVLPRERSSKEHLAALRAAAMVGRRCFERGLDCIGCHRAGAIGPLVRPGSSPGRATALEHLENRYSLAPGEKWYFPQIQ